MPGSCSAVQSSPAKTPARGPAKSGTLSATTGNRVSAKRDGSPLALRMTPWHCGFRRSSTRSKMVRPPIRMRALSPPPMRRAKPPASTRPRVSLLIAYGRLPPMLGAFLLHISEVLVEHDAALARKGDEAFAARASDQREIGLARQFHAPGREA